MITINAKNKTLLFEGKPYACRIGRDGYIAQECGREGDNKTPLGTYALRYGLYRADRLPNPKSALTFRPIRLNDGWCDDPADPAYNQFVRRPYPASTEQLYKEAHIYDIILVLGHNDSPPIAGLGSAIFMHICRPDHRPTAGCIAIEPELMIALLPHLKMGLPVQIKR